MKNQVIVTVPELTEALIDWLKARGIQAEASQINFDCSGGAQSLGWIGQGTTAYAIPSLRQVVVNIFPNPKA